MFARRAGRTRTVVGRLLCIPGPEQVHLASRLKVIAPCDVALLYKDGFILAVVSDAFEEDPTSEKRYLQRLYVDPDFEFTPRVGSDSVGNESSKDAVEVEEEPVDELGWSVSEHVKHGGGQLTQIHTMSSITQVL